MNIKTEEKCNEVKKEGPLKRFIREKICLRILKGILNILDRMEERKKEGFITDVGKYRYYIIFVWSILLIFYYTVKKLLQ